MILGINGLSQHAQEVKLFLQTFHLDILLVSETHFTERNYMKIPNYIIYHTAHPDETAHGGTAILIRQTIKHYVRAEYKEGNIQATSISIADDTGEITVSAIYCPPKHNNKYDDYVRFFMTLGNRFLVGGDFNAKHTFWGSRLINTKGRELYKVIHNNNLKHLSTRQPTYWPSDPRKIPDLLDLCITKGLDTRKFTVASCLELTSDHTPILITMHANVIGQPTKPSLYSKRTDWNYFREILDNQLTLTVPLKTKIDIEEAVINITTAIQNAAWQATPDRNNQTYMEESPIIIHQKIAAKRKARKRWQLTRAPQDKQYYNKLAKELKHLLRTHKNESIQNYLQELTPTAATDYSLWRATRKLKHPQHHIPPLRVNSTTWARTDKQKATILPSGGRQHRGFIVPQAVTHSLVLMKMGKIIARNMLS